MPHVLVLVIAALILSAPDALDEVVGSGLYALRQMDLHLHAGLEREVPLDEWIDLAVKGGRKVIVVLDHRELYDMTPEEHAAWVAKHGFRNWYPTGMAGRRALMADLAGLRARKDVITFRGWEISEDELDGKLDPETIRMAEVVGFHISPNSLVAPCGKTLLKRVRQIIALQKTHPMPMVVFHPFPMRVERIHKDARARGQDPSTLTVGDYRFFQPGEQEELARLLKGKSIYIEIGAGTGAYWSDPAAREAFIADIKPLADAGVQFTVSTDAHGIRSTLHPFEPESYCGALGVTPANTNGLVRELLQRRRAVR